MSEEPEWVKSVAWEGELSVNSMNDFPFAKGRSKRGVYLNEAKYRIVVVKAAGRAPTDRFVPLSVERYTEDAMGAFAWVAQDNIFVIASVLRSAVVQLTDGSKGAGA